MLVRAIFRCLTKAPGVRALWHEMVLLQSVPGGGLEESAQERVCPLEVQSVKMKNRDLSEVLA